MDSSCSGDKVLKSKDSPRSGCQEGYVCCIVPKPDTADTNGGNTGEI
jgi:hypothetical protein